jgi:hypothetical protein
MPDPRSFCERRSAVLARERRIVNTPFVPSVDSGDDEIRRYVVYLNTYVPDRRERTQLEVGCFDTEAEGMRCLGDAYLELASRQGSGDADSRDRLSMVIKEPGIDSRNRQRRIEERRLRHS